MNTNSHTIINIFYSNIQKQCRLSYTQLQQIFNIQSSHKIFYQQLSCKMTHRTKRIQKEIFDLKIEGYLQQIELLDLHPQLESATFAFTGPIDSPYQGYWFRIFIEWPQQYPMMPPKVKLIDKIWNPYVDFEKNQICVDILGDQFSPSLTTPKILLSIISLFGQTKISENHKGFANPKAAVQLMNNYPFFCQQARKICESHSFKRKELYNNCQRGIAEEHFIKAEGKQLQKLVEWESHNPKMLKKTQRKKLSQRNLNEFFIHNPEASIGIHYKQTNEKDDGHIISEQSQLWQNLMESQVQSQNKDKIEDEFPSLLQNLSISEKKQHK